ncbi:hypothetical protein [Streptomyces sp. CBMA123]|uniref:hypothetical protein n=1 Tax=Streptomyces sp. CBMA123 TaxID=1896313 RepID=UPI00166219E9|nr:hypothetical protein [Streptomyces sp. CBMA123]MBD0694333.1 hypothetical protein [Streptomyces sp. CBMA123]
MRDDDRRTPPIETERYIRFQLDHLTARNEHHTFEEISYRIALRRLSSNIVPATGPVSSGGDQGRDAESYYTNLPLELPGAGGFVGRATTEPLVVAASVQKDQLDAKIRSDLRSICGRGERVARVAFFAVSEIPVSVRHRLQEHARETHHVSLEIFDGLAVAQFLAEGDLLWVAQRFLDLPSNLVPELPGEPQPDWYTRTLTALREREFKRLVPGAHSEIRDGLRHATFDAEARVDLPEWLGYMREFVRDRPDDDLSARARYECAVAVLRGLNTLDGAEEDIRAVVQHAMTSDLPSILEDASILLMYWGGAWLRRLGTALPEEIRHCNLRLRERVRSLLDTTDVDAQPIRRVRLLSVAAHLCLHPRWTEVERPEPGVLPTPEEASAIARRMLEEEDIDLVHLPENRPLDVNDAMGYLAQLAALLPTARAFPVGNVIQLFELLAASLADDPRYEAVRDALDTAEGATAGDSAIAARARARAMSFRRAGRPLQALRELHDVKLNWWHGDTLRGSLLAMRLIGRIYGELRLVYAAKQYSLAAALIALSSEDESLHDLVPEALTEAMHHAYAAGMWTDATALAGIAVKAHAALAEQAFDRDAHPGLGAVDFAALTPLLTAERFRPEILPVLRSALDDAAFERDLTEALDDVRPAYTFTEEGLTTATDEQLAGRPFGDLGPRRTLAFSALGTTWWVSCRNDRATVLAAERLVAAAQVLLVELVPQDPVFLVQDVRIDVTVDTGRPGVVSFEPGNDGVTCAVALSPYHESADPAALEHELASTLVYLIAHLSARPPRAFMDTVRRAFENGLHHKLYVARPYDESAALLGESHYTTAAGARVAPLTGPGYRPATAEVLRARNGPGPGYDHAAALAEIRDNYAYFPTLIDRTLPRALSDPTTIVGLRELRDEGWLDWHLLLAMTNISINVRARAAGLLTPDVAPERLKSLTRQRESEGSVSVVLSTLTPEGMRSALRTAALAVGRRRWGLGTAVRTPNTEAFVELLRTRYGFATDDVPHRDLLAAALADDGTVLPLIGP